MTVNEAAQYYPVQECLPDVKHSSESWYRRHVSAICNPTTFEESIVMGLQAWLTYAQQHARRYESLIGEDYLIGEYWKDWGQALRHLLNGETGRLDCGTVDSFIYRIMTEHGIDTDNL